ncbi:MAG: BrnT family toxin [Rhodospirillaceae bacterium]
MIFEWDEDKNRQNIAKHGLSFESATGIFDGFTLNSIDNRFEYGEIREISIGMIETVAVVSVVHTDRNGRCRIISARPAVRSERLRYEKALRKAFNP